MVVDERARYELFQQLQRTLGEEAAATLMEHLPPVGWGDVVTRRDLDGATALLRSELHGEMAALSSELRGEMASLSSELRGEMASLSSELRGEMASLGERMSAQLADLRTDFRGELNAALIAQTRMVVFSTLGAVVAVAGLALGLR